MRSRLPQQWLIYKQKKALALRTIKRAKKAYWQNYCQSLNKDSSLSKVWNTIRNISNGQEIIFNNFPVLIFKNHEYIEDIDKAELLAKTFQQVSQDSNYSISFIKQKSEFFKNNNFVTRQLPINDCILDENFKMERT